MCPTAGNHGRLSLPSQSLPAGTARCCRVLWLPGPETGRGAGRFGEPSMGPGRQSRRPAWGTVPRPAALSSQGAGSHGVHILISAGRAGPEVSPDGVAGGRGRGYPGGRGLAPACRSSFPGRACRVGQQRQRAVPGAVPPGSGGGGGAQLGPWALDLQVPSPKERVWASQKDRVPGQTHA